MTDKYWSARLKIDRAKQQITEIERLIEEVLVPGSYKLILDSESQPGHHFIKFQSNGSAGFRLLARTATVAESARHMSEKAICLS